MNLSTSDSMDVDTNLENQSSTSETYLLLKTGEHSIQNPDGTFRCPFCPNRKKRNYLYNEILNHATGVEASPARSITASSSHRALATFLRSDVPKPLTTKEQEKTPNPDADDGCNTDDPERDDRFVYPWTGVLANLPVKLDLTSGRRVGESGSRLKEELSRFNPVRVRPVWNFLGHSGTAVVEFTQDWKGFKDAMMFHKFFKVRGFGRKDWEKKKNHGLRDMFGWIARAEDFNSDEPIGMQMRKNRELTTIAEVKAGAVRKRGVLVEKLESEIVEKDRYVEELKVKYGEDNMYYLKLMEERTKILDKYNEEVLKMRKRASDHSRVVVADNAKLKAALEAKRIELDTLVKESENKKRTSSNYRDQLESQMTALRIATLEQEKSDGCVMKLLEIQKKEKEAAFHKILEMEKQLDATQKLELEIQQLEDKLQVMTHMNGEKDKIFESNEELKQKLEEMECVDAMNQALLIKENLAKEELESARQMLVKAILVMVKGSVNPKIRIKMMGELDKKAFELACKQRFPKEEHAKIENIYSTWQENIKNVEWNPYKNAILNGQAQEVIDEEDEQLKGLKSDLGNEAYKSVCAALLEMKASGSRDVVSEFWSKDGRKATMSEAIRFFLGKWKGKIK